MVGSAERHKDALWKVPEEPLVHHLQEQESQETLAGVEEVPAPPNPAKLEQDLWQLVLPWFGALQKYT